MADAGPEWDEIVAEARREVLSSLLGSDLNRLTDLFARVREAAHRDRAELRQALCEVAARVSVYRTYLTASPRCVPDVDAGIIERAVASATAARSDLDPELFALLGRVLRLEVDGPAAEELAMRFQQLTPAAMAKGVEDTAFYRHHRLVALNEVGGDPGRFGTSVAAFHEQLAAAAAEWPAAMLSLSTHDTKRSADVRARLALLSEDPPGWLDAVERLGRASARHRVGAGMPTDADAYLFFQTLIGAWPIDADRAAAYLLKATREAKLRTSWVAPDAAYEDALARFVRGAMGDGLFVEAVEAAVAPLVDAGRRASLGQLALALTAPGVPDLYQGDELWQLVLVDPDNRRPVDYAVRRRLLADARVTDAAARVGASRRGAAQDLARAPCTRPAPPARGDVSLRRLPADAGRRSPRRCGLRLRAWRGGHHGRPAPACAGSSGSAGPTPAWRSRRADGGISMASSAMARSRWPSSLPSSRSRSWSASHEPLARPGLLHRCERRGADDRSRRPCRGGRRHGPGRGGCRRRRGGPPRRAACRPRASSSSRTAPAWASPTRCPSMRRSAITGSCATTAASS